jgi:hypothetical protein
MRRVASSQGDRSLFCEDRLAPKAKIGINIEYGLYGCTRVQSCACVSQTCKLRVTLDRTSYRYPGLSLKSKKYEDLHVLVVESAN